MDSSREPVLAAAQAWEAALRTCAARLQAERGVADQWSVTREAGDLWVNYGQFRVRVGVDTDVQTETQLFDALDSWVADDRLAGPGRWLPRDEAAREKAEAAAERITPWVQAAANRLAVDLHNAWGVATVWRVVTSRASLPLVWPGSTLAGEPTPGQPPAADFGLWLTETAEESATSPAEPMAGSPRDEPEVWVFMQSRDGSEAGHTVSLWDLKDQEDAVEELIDLFEDDLVEEVWGKWPTCPTHGRTLQLERLAGAASWLCPRGKRPLARVGSLTKDSHASVT